MAGFQVYLSQVRTGHVVREDGGSILPAVVGTEREGGRERRRRVEQSGCDARDGGCNRKIAIERVSCPSVGARPIKSAGCVQMGAFPVLTSGELRD